MKLSRDLNDLTDKMKEAAVAVMDRFPNVFITETGRSEEQQRENIARGVSWTMNSKHMMNPKSRAFDIAFRGDELYPSDYSQWREVADFLKGYEVDWGFDLWETDKPHFQCNGKIYNKKDMTEFKHDYVQIQEDEVKMTTVGHNHADKDSVEENIKAIAEIICDRKIKKIIEVLQEALNK